MTLLECSALRNAWFAWPNPPVEQANDRVELLQLLAERAQRAPHASEAVRFAIEAALRIVRHPALDAARGQPLLDAIIDAVASDPGDASFGLHGLDKVSPDLRFGRFIDAFERASSGAVGGMTRHVARAYRTHPAQDRYDALSAGLARLPDAPGIGSSIVQILGELPSPAAIPTDHIDGISTALHAAVDRPGVQPWYREQVAAWLIP